MTINTEQVMHAISKVEDPCGRLIGSHASLVDLGMLKAITVDGHRVMIELLLDDPICVYMFEIQHSIREVVSRVEGVETVEISICANEIWTKERLMSRLRTRSCASADRAETSRAIE